MRNFEIANFEIDVVLRRVSGQYESSQIITRTRRVDDGTLNAQHSMINDQLPENNELFALNIEN